MFRMRADDRDATVEVDVGVQAAMRASVEPSRRIRFVEACARGVMCPDRPWCDRRPCRPFLVDRLSQRGFTMVGDERHARDAGGGLADAKVSSDDLRGGGF